MSIDEQYQQLQLFEKALTRFHDHLQASTQNLDQTYQLLEPFWQDQMRRDHDSKWVLAIEIVKTFLTFTGHQYIAFFIERIQWLERYLKGAH